MRESTPFSELKVSLKIYNVTTYLFSIHERSNGKTFQLFHVTLLRKVEVIVANCGQSSALYNMSIGEGMGKTNRGRATGTVDNPLLFTICRLERVWGGPTEEELQEGMFGILNKGLKRK